MGLSLDVTVDGARSDVLSARWRSLSVVDGIDYELDGATLEISAPAPLEVEIPRLGAELAFAVDGRNLGGPLRATAIRGDNRAGSVTVEAGALHPRSVLREPRDASWSGRTIGDIAGAIASRAGLVAAVSASVGGAAPKGAIQSAESDLQFLRRLVARMNGKVIHKAGRLTVLGVGETVSATGKALPAVAIDLRSSGAWVRWRRTEAATVDIAQAIYLEDDGATPARLTLGEAPSGARPKRRKLPGVYGSRGDAEAAIRRVLAAGRSGVDRIEIETSLMPSARALYPLSLAGAPSGFPARLRIQEVRHTLGRSVAMTTVSARP